MDLDELGAHCSLECCNERDFLPIQCSCSQMFCRFHISPDSHSCTAAQQSETAVSLQTTAARPKCAFPGCSKPSLIISPSTTGQGGSGEKHTAAAWSSFCVDHRHVQSPLSSGIGDGNAETPVRGLARPLPVNIGSRLPNTPVAVRSAKSSTDPKKSAQLHKVNMMKMRHKAVPGDPKDKGSHIPMDQRLHVNVCYDVDGSIQQEGIFWFQKSITVGKILDLVATHFNISSSKASTLTLHKSSPKDDGELLALQNHQPLSEEVNDASHLILA
ncbi:hypothetical protein J3A83DRAFT_4252563 [Scleroderma citrinum]